MLTQEKVKQLFRYDRETGLFFWRYPGKGRRSGLPAGSLNQFGYNVLRIDGRRYVAKIALISNFVLITALVFVEFAGINKS